MVKLDATDITIVVQIYNASSIVISKIILLIYVEIPFICFARRLLKNLGNYLSE